MTSVFQPCPGRTVTNKEVLIYNPLITYYYYILTKNNIKVLILVFLYKSNSSNLSINNIIIKFEIIINNKVFIFFN